MLQADINAAYSCLWKYHEICKDKNADHTLKIVALTGSIGGRGVRYKSTEHKFVLTDMYFAFDVRSDRHITMHGESAIQAVGRLCTVVLDLKATPTITLWTPTNCAILLEQWMKAQDEWIASVATQHDGETVLQALQRAIADEKAPTIGRLMSCAVGKGKKGQEFFLPEHRRKVSAHKIRRQLDLERGYVCVAAVETAIT
jgi:hypothetical protein